jgi:hypothetical protein
MESTSLFGSGSERVGPAYLTTDIRGGVTVVTARDGLFDAMPESDKSAPVAAEVVAEFRSAIVGTPAVVVDLRRAGEVNNRTLNVAFQMARALKGCDIRGRCVVPRISSRSGMCVGGTPFATCMRTSGRRVRP